jgi:hypothetical protein
LIILSAAAASELRVAIDFFFGRFDSSIVKKYNLFNIVTVLFGGFLSFNNALWNYKKESTKTPPSKV